MANISLGKLVHINSKHRKHTHTRPIWQYGHRKDTYWDVLFIAKTKMLHPIKYVGFWTKRVQLVLIELRFLPLTQPGNCNTEPTRSIWAKCLAMNAWALARLANQPSKTCNRLVPIFLSLFQLTPSHRVAFFFSFREKKIQTENKMRRKARTTGKTMVKCSHIFLIWDYTWMINTWSVPLTNTWSNPMWRFVYEQTAHRETTALVRQMNMLYDRFGFGKFQLDLNLYAMIFFAIFVIRNPLQLWE